MTLIDDSSSARQLAEAIAEDLRLYNADKLAAGADLSTELDEARALYRARVSERLFPLFDEVVPARLGVAAIPSALLSASPPQPQSSSAGPLALLVLLAAIGAAVYFFLTAKS